MGLCQALIACRELFPGRKWTWIDEVHCVAYHCTCCSRPRMMASLPCTRLFLRSMFGKLYVCIVVGNCDGHSPLPGAEVAK